MTKTILLAGLLAAGLVSPVLAANANRPYQNCDRKIDNCGPTGDDMTDKLNGQQLGGSSTTPMSAPMGSQTGAPPMQGATH